MGKERKIDTGGFQKLLLGLETSVRHGKQ